MGIFCRYVSILYMYLVNWIREGVESLGTAVTDGCEPPCDWELNPTSLQEYQVLLTTGPTLQPLNSIIIIIIRNHIFLSKLKLH